MPVHERYGFIDIPVEEPKTENLLSRNHQINIEPALRSPQRRMARQAPSIQHPTLNIELNRPARVSFALCDSLNRCTVAS